MHTPDLSVLGKLSEAPGLSNEKIFPFTLLSNTFSIFPEDFHSFKGFLPKLSISVLLNELQIYPPCLSDVRRRKESYLEEWEARWKKSPDKNFETFLFKNTKESYLVF